MTTHLAGQSRRAAFTLIELLTVITIILILAGLILGIAGNAQNKAARSRAEGEIKAMETACGAYQIDNGTYPRDPSASGSSATDTLDAQKNLDPAGNPTSNPYVKASLALYRMIGGAYYYDGGNFTIWSSGATTSSGATVPKPTIYMPFKNSQLQNSGNITTGFIDPKNVTAIVDPFGFSYGYSTAYQADVDKNNATTPPGTTAPTHGYNPTFDLWSTAGYSASAGKPFPKSGPGSTATDYNTLWVKNW